jgi:hypothetical protein
VTAGTGPRTATRGSTGEPATSAQPADAGGDDVRAGERAASEVLDKHTMLFTLPAGLGTVRLPAPQELAFYGGITALAAFGIVDWPVVLLIGIGHLLAEDRRRRVLVEFGEALSEA